jgi:hypothetical protein
MSNLTLYQVAAEYLEAANKLAELDIDEQTLADTLESISGDLTVKAQNVAFVIRNLEATAEQIKVAAAGMTGRAKALEKRAQNIRAYLLDNMRFAGVEKIECPYFKLSIRKNPPSVCIDDERQIPAAYMVDIPPPPPVPNKTAIGDAIKLGQEVPGCRLTQGVRLEIR